jgi:hypothetical protein
MTAPHGHTIIKAVYVVNLPLTGKSLVIHGALLTRLHTRIYVKNVRSFAREKDRFALAVVSHVVIKSI